jgi:ubiquitin C-terminal hydrolase
MCKHFSEEVDGAAFKKTIEAIPQSFWGKPSCSTCSKRGEVWICLSKDCGFTGCGRLENAHMLAHGQQSQHNIAMNLKSTMIWCYACDDEVVVSDTDTVRKILVDKFSSNMTAMAPKVNRQTPNTPVKGTKGLSNIGNTCFLAASMQCLSHTHAFQKLLRHCSPYSKEELQTPSAQQRLVVAIRNFFIQQWGDPHSTSSLGPGFSVLSPDEILSAVQRLNSLFHGYQQHDSQEFLRFTLSTMHDELKIAKSSIISDVFGGKTCSTVTCLRCKKESQCIEDFYDLSLPIPNEPFAPEAIARVLQGLEEVAPTASSGASVSTTSWLWAKTKSALGLASDPRVSLADCLVQFMRLEKLSGTDAYYCEHCKQKTECLKRMSIRKLPEVLVVHLKRFRHDWGTTKVGKTVTFPVSGELDLAPFVDAQETFSKYKLTGLVQHIGSIGSGHYVSYCKHKTSGSWYLFDDSRVTPISNPSSVEQTEAYVLFFQRVPEQATIFERKLACEAIKKSGGNLIPREWIAQVKTMSVVPALSAEHVLCPHQLPSTACPLHARTLFVSVSPEYAQRVCRKYAKDSNVCPLSLDMCKLCDLYLKAYNHRLSLEHKLVTKLDTKNIPDGERWYFIDAAWVTAWRVYLRHGSIADSNKGCSPGPVKTEALVKKILTASKTDIAKLKLTSDFIAVNKNVWSLFVHCHGAPVSMVTGPSLDVTEATVGPNDEEVSLLEQVQMSADEWGAIGRQFVDVQRASIPDAVNL